VKWHLPIRRALICAPLLFLILGGCTLQRAGRLEKTDRPSAQELRQEWQNYQVFHRLDSALVFKLRDSKQILFVDAWQEITDAQTLSRVGFWNATYPPMKILGENDQLFGYIIYTMGNGAGVTIVDPQTVRLFYFIQKKDGP
jgi:hypothetical protein